MADKKISALNSIDAPTATDLVHIVTDMGTTPTNKRITVQNFFKTIPTFIGFGDTVTTAAADVLPIPVTASILRKPAPIALSLIMRNIPISPVLLT